MYIDYRVKAELRVIHTLKRIGYEGFGTELDEGYEEVLRLAELASLKPFFLVSPKGRVPREVSHLTLRVVKPHEVKKGFDLLELEDGTDGIRETYRFCKGIGYTKFKVEVQLGKLRRLKGRELMDYLNALVELVKMLRRRKIGMVFSSGARDWMELVSPRAVKEFEKYIKGEFGLKLREKGKRRYIHLVGNGSLGELKERFLELFGSLAFRMAEAKVIRLEEGLALRCGHNYLDAWLLCLALSDSKFVSLGASGTLKGIRRHLKG